MPPSSSRLPSDHDALTVLASTANQVTLVTYTGGRTAVADQVLQGDINNVGAGPGTTGLGFLLMPLADYLHLEPGEHLLLFTSFDRSGSCVSAAFSYEPTQQTATYLVNYDDPPGENGPLDQIQVPGRLLLIPHTVTLAAVKQRLDPTGPVIYPENAGEDECPGP